MAKQNNRPSNKNQNPEDNEDMNEDPEDEDDLSARDNNDESEDDASMLGSSEQSDQDVSDDDSSVEAVGGTKKRVQKFMTKQEIAANRALRIKMGKSGVHAASRRPTKQGKEACQRKLWNQEVRFQNFEFKF